MTCQNIDVYQERYLIHQRKKAEQLSGSGFDYPSTPSSDLWDILSNRTSQRVFNSKDISDTDISFIKYAIINTPSSCNRQGVRVRFVRDAEEKGYFDKALVGGANWIKNANIILLLLADMVAYKSPAERQFMPYLDAGFIGMAVYCACESLGVGCCFVNPNVLDTYEEDVSSRYNKLCGAIALGNYDKKPAKTPKRSDVFEDK